MTLPELENLVRIGRLRTEPPLLEGSARAWCDQAKSRAADAARKELAFESRFDLVCSAAHAWPGSEG